MSENSRPLILVGGLVVLTVMVLLAILLPRGG